MTLRHDPTRTPSGSQEGGQDAEAELVVQARRGDAAALERLLAPHLSHALAVARRITGSTGDAEDLVQDACLRAIEQLHRFTPGRPFGPWFLRLLMNLGFNQHKASLVRATEPLEETHHPSRSDPLAEAEASDFRGRFAAAIDALPPRQRVIVMMFEVDGYSGAEIATTLGISVDTVRWHLHEARHALRRVLAVFEPARRPRSDDA